jgi:putative flippase GtrA
MKSSGFLAEAGRFLRANLSSTLASAVDYVVAALLLLVHAHYQVAVVGGAISGGFADFALKRYWAFDRAAKAPVHHEGVRYALVSGTSLLLNMAVAYLFVERWGAPSLPGIIAASIVVGFVWNYPLHRYFVFRAAVVP